MFNFPLHLGKLAAALLIIAGLFLMHIPVAQANSMIEVQYISGDGQSLSKLLEGAIGEGWLLYNRMGEDPLQPVLVVHLRKHDLQGPVSASVYQPQNGESHITLANLESLQSLPELRPALVEMQAVDGWWVKDSLVNYNLDIQIYGPMYAMWGAGYDPKLGPQGWAAEITPGDLAVDIQVRDTDQDGLPDWELRRLIPEFRGKGYYRVNYSERKCDTPVEMDPGVFAAWPFIASTGGFEQEPGKFSPPIVVDWEMGKITHFSELVTARNQNCSYTIYSIEPLKSGQINQPDFETPFAFYDLSGEGVGYPNLILRTERYPANDPWMPATGQPFEQIRYTWKNEVGDWLWDYKVDVLGFHPYTSQTSIAGGQYRIDAPAYEEFPSWVMDKSWPIVTFIDTEGKSYRSSEGIYEWSPRAFGVPYFVGQQDSPDLSEFLSIRQGLRGEFRIGETAPVRLYYSAIDARLHLLGAQAGLFQVDEDLRLREVNLNRDNYLDGWLLEVVSGEVGTTAFQALPVQALYQLGNTLLYTDGNHLKLYKTNLVPAEFEISPPVDQASWRLFREKMTPYDTARKDPHDLLRWLDDQDELLFTLGGVTTHSVRADGAGYRFVLDLTPGFSLAGNDLLSLGSLPAGAYVVTLEGDQLAIAPLAPPQVSLDLLLDDTSRSVPALQVQLANLGTADLAEGQLQVLQICAKTEPTIIHETELDLLAGAAPNILIPMPATFPADCTIQVQVAGEAGQILATKGLNSEQIQVAYSSEWGLLGLSSGAGSRLPVFLLLLIGSGLAGLVALVLYRGQT